MQKYDERFVIPEDILSDLCSRFIINVPEEERTDLIRIFFQIEIAHWFYLDFYCEASSYNTTATSSSSSSSFSSDEDESAEKLVKQKPHRQHQLKPCSIRAFAENIFRHCPFLMQHSNQVDEILSKWKMFKHAVPTNGAIILDETMRYVLLVQGFWAKASWGFPKGKVFEEESEANCAIREVLEETGYDISDKLVDNEYLQININDQVIRLYIVPNVSIQTKFEPRTRREIKEVRWFRIDELPIHRKDLRTKEALGYSPNAFFMVIPFVKALRKWVSIKLSLMNGTNRFHLNGASISSTASKLLGGHRDPSLYKQQGRTRSLIHKEGKDIHSSSFNGEEHVTKKQTIHQEHFGHGAQSLPITKTVQQAPRAEFAGPDCWINFKFDYGPIMKNLSNDFP